MARKLTEEHKEKIRRSRLGKKRQPFSKEWRERMSIAQRNKPPVSKETRLKMSIASKNRKRTPEWNRKNGLAHRGLKYPPFSLEHRKKLSLANKGSNGSGWKGGVSTKNSIIRQSFEYRLWRTAVFERDNYTCIWCKQRGGKLHADHIKPFAYYPELRFAIDNGRTLCVECHKTTDTYCKQRK